MDHDPLRAASARPDIPRGAPGAEAGVRGAKAVW